MLFFLHGEDVFRSKEKLNELKERFIKNNSSSGLFIFDFSDKSITESSFLESFKSSGLFSTKKLVIAMDFLKSVPLENQKNLLETLKDRPEIEKDSDLTLVFQEQGKPKKTTSFYKYLAKKAKQQEFFSLDARGTEKWANEYITAHFPDIRFESKALSMLTFYVGNDLFLLKNELGKICTFKTKGSVSGEDVDLLVKSHFESTVFQTIEALLGQDKKMTLKLLHQQLQKGEDPFYLLSMYAYQIRTLLKISAAFENGNTQPQYIAKETGLHPFVVQKAMSQIRKHSLEYLKKIHKQLEIIDIAAKTGKDSIPSALDKFIAGL